jgi:hypothetical protein
MGPDRQPVVREYENMAKSTTRRATAADVLKILTEDPVEVYRRLRLPVQRAQLSMPRDEKGPRIKVSLQPGSKVKVPSRLVFELDGRSVQVPLEAAEDYQTYSLQ